MSVCARQQVHPVHGNPRRSSHSLSRFLSLSFKLKLDDVRGFIQITRVLRRGYSRKRLPDFPSAMPIEFPVRKAETSTVCVCVCRDDAVALSFYISGINNRS